MKEEKIDRNPKTARRRDPQPSERDRKAAVRRSPSRGTRELRSKQTSRHEDNRTKRDVSSRGQREHNKASSGHSTRSRHDDKRKRSRSPGRRISDDNERPKMREAPEAKKERKEALKGPPVRVADSSQFAFGKQEVQKDDVAIANGGFGSVDFQTGFGDIGFSNSGFTNTGFRKNVGMNESNRSGTQSKPRILAPGGRDGTRQITEMAAPKFTVNELSAESIKRDGSNPTARTIQPNEKAEKGKSETEQALVPRGRNYFIHDHRDTTFANQRNQSNIRFGQGRGRAPIGWRNFGDGEGNVDKTNFAMQNYGRGGGVVGGSARGGFAKFGNFQRSKADEDLIWKHDKYVEVSQDEANTRLELIDEVGVEPQEVIFDKTRPQEGESRHRYQEECFDYEVEELAVYD
uniref:Btz domain-containing protein n=1 Tax=Meloidogyne hapla TaxID=6305 RepID=A0A1I8BPA1_MELHA